MSMSTPHPNTAALAVIYADLCHIERYADDDIVLHTAQRETGSGPALVRGKAAVTEKMRALRAQSGDTLDMHVECTVANDYFGSVLGKIRVRRDNQTFTMPFCGLWRFRDGRIVEHWENAYDIAALDAFMSGIPQETPHSFTPEQSLSP
ncbi:nuclear transport factor 2 family protein [Luteibacter sp. E-22]|uniref:nuclear transport factor 2 family protein n=1 Tax=Luteibacter sp. E-22 TaxID=3404050 RepID=UPI003CF9479D